MCHGGYDGDLFNETMQPLLELITTAGAARAAAEVDAFLLEVSNEVVAISQARTDAPNLDRGSHRGYHLEQIERALSKSAIC